MTEATLDGLASEFADKLTALTRGVLGDDAPRFHAIELVEDKRVRVQPIEDDRVVRDIPVTVGGVHRIDLRVSYDCCWDGASRFLAADKSEFKVFYKNVPDPLFRFEYERKASVLPGAHIHVHAHRDEVAYLLRLSDAGRPGSKLRRDRLPRSSELHLPVGGHRMRPSLEDVFLFLVREFAIDTAVGWEKVLGEHVQDWRITQLKAAVRDAPDAAVEVLRDLGYRIDAPAIPAPRSSGTAKLFLP
ncbi:hypothetical protein MTQ13_03235 [Streptomyces sp. XM4011]|uniref:hypothetical protein n=1 Tax=Streptomyces sp. XM4011 TaxID=2929780 RepID=UPI001FFA16F7|nr:hypothetical protein [Streptomyces sp. XM4011]MCK1813295.1 hypothetical protein [Streptomyces sp. XM4011]